MTQSTVTPDGAAPPRIVAGVDTSVGASVTVVRAWRPAAAYSGYGGYDAAPDLAAIQTAEGADVATLVKAVRQEFPHVDTITRVVRGNPVPVLTNAALGSRLLVVGAHRRRGPLSVGIGYVDQGLLSHSPTPVAVVPIV
ncbi:MAG TPA: universal stress protein [Actinocrinis sp.]|nr:universal stress protein [Actinocrinis sp.]